MQRFGQKIHFSNKSLLKIFTCKPNAKPSKLVWTNNAKTNVNALVIAFDLIREHSEMLSIDDVTDIVFGDKWFISLILEFLSVILW